ncbi:SusC/RagA family TonB-linked outer membrane protein [Mucilaginibacter sp. X4EP1]|uniref:SusC/RagA family TonB-linked outer membrane protein n=1 Tax=Mucilaginibacter sp. X4EP1 TaxID=2723092 RepID=UPI002166F51B|nr:TonB-dependent receptor [Mucilaginibacter sp. X4EP1]MCS3814637.1 TonB-linked SusC/RagA family outer membrane protein [Mucilaginibacter sp. X4EP1]
MRKFFTCRSRLLNFYSAKIKIVFSPHLLPLLLGVLISASVFAQNPGKIQGTVYDEKGETLPGVSVALKGTEAGTITDLNGKFSINASQKQTLLFSFIGYVTKAVVIKNDEPINVTLVSNSSALNEVVVVGYGSQKKASLTTAVSSIDSKDIVDTKNENVENMLTGKIAGLQVVQNTAEPGDFNNNIAIRGFNQNPNASGNPLIVIDGVEMPDFNVTGGNGDNSSSTSNILSRLDPNDIESISVLKDASSAVYGVKAANGVILVTTKKGKKGSLQLSYSGTFGSQVPSGLPKPVDAVDYMTLSNQLSMHQANGGRIVYTPADFAAYTDGSKQSTDWYDAVFKKSAFQEQHNLSATGGNENTTYLLSGGFTGQDGFLTSNDLTYKRYNVRSNITSKIAKNLTLNLNLSAIMDQKNAPLQSIWWTTRETWRELPTQTIYANNNPAYLNLGLVDGGNPVAYENSDVNGYSTQNNKFFNGLMSLEYKLPFIDGLTLKGLYSYNDQIQDNKQFGESYNLYSYDAATSTYNPTLTGAPSYVQRQYYNYVQNTDQLSLNYNHTFGGVHNVTALLLYEGNGQSADNFAAYRQLALPVDQLFAGNALNQNATQDSNGLYDYASNSLVGRVHYDYKGIYLGEFSFRDDESSKFPPSQKRGFFPSGSLAWNISEEDFWKNSSALSFIDQLKLRASYGVLGDDNTLYYQFLQGYYYPANGNNNQLPSGSVFNNTFINAVQSTSLPNPNIGWETSHTFDAGIDFDAWKGQLNVTFDVFRRDRSGLFSSSAIQVPDVLGIGLPQQNLNGDRTQGFDFEVGHRGHVGKFNYNVRGTFSYANTMNTTYVEPKYGNSYLDWQNDQAGRNVGLAWGLGGSGQYQSYSQILNSPTYVNRATVVGDYNYQDWNGDGQVDGNDNHPIAYVGPPKITYGLNISGSYSAFDVSLLIQGTAMVDVSYIEQLNIPLWGGGSALTQFMNDWHPANPNADPYNPNTVWVPGNFAYTGTTANTNSTFNYQSAAYVRLKSAELGYTLPKSVLTHLGIRGVRLFVNGYNLLTWTKLKYVDPEHPSGSYGYLYPLDKLFNVGLNVKF